MGKGGAWRGGSRQAGSGEIMSEKMEITKKQIVDLLTAQVMLIRKIDAVDTAVGQNAFLELFGSELDILGNTILDLCGVPPEHTRLEAIGIDISDFSESDIEYGFCRDSIENALFNIETNLDLDDEEVVIACDAFVSKTLEEWMPEYAYIVKREET